MQLASYYAWIIAYADTCLSCKYNRAVFLVILAICIRLRFSHTYGTGHQHGETPQYCPSLAVQQIEFQADLYSATNAFYRYGNN
jgi:hypothetical protein